MQLSYPQLLNLLSSGIQPIVEFKPTTKVQTSYDKQPMPPFPGMKARILGVEAFEEEYNMEIEYDFGEFQEHNKPFIPADSVLHPECTTVWPLSVPKTELEKMPFIFVEGENPFLVEFAESNEKIGYVQWLEKKLLSQLK